MKEKVRSWERKENMSGNRKKGLKKRVPLKLMMLSEAGNKLGSWVTLTSEKKLKNTPASYPIGRIIRCPSPQSKKKG